MMQVELTNLAALAVVFLFMVGLWTLCSQAAETLARHLDGRTITIRAKWVTLALYAALFLLIGTMGVEVR